MVSTGPQKPSAAVIVIVRNGQILLTRRAITMNSHSYEVALPGGKWEPGDTSLLQTALRETAEEVGVTQAQLNVLGDLPCSVTLKGVSVQPYVAELIDHHSEPFINSEEVDALFWLPEKVLQADERIRTDVFVMGGRHYWSPAYRYDEFVVWGFTSRVLVQYLKKYQGIEIAEANRAPVARHSR